MRKIVYALLFITVLLAGFSVGYWKGTSVQNIATKGYGFAYVGAAKEQIERGNGIKAIAYLNRAVVE